MPRVVHVTWSYPKEWDSALKGIEATSNGVYQIYRTFGACTSLLYIGLVKSDSRDFRCRMQEHRRDWLYAKRGAIYLRFGGLRTFKGLTVTDALIEEVESVLIFEHQPPENTQKKSSYSIRQDLIVKNFGYRGELKEEIDTTLHG